MSTGRQPLRGQIISVLLLLILWDSYIAMPLFPKKNSLKAVYEDDLIGYLESLGIYKDIVEGKHLCGFCGNKITLDSLEAILTKEGKITVVCSNKNCLNQI